MQNASVNKRLLARYQNKVWEVRSVPLRGWCVVLREWSGECRAGRPGRWRSQGCGMCEEKATRKEESHPKREAMRGTGTSSAVGLARSAHALWSWGITWVLHTKRAKDFMFALLCCSLALVSLVSILFLLFAMGIFTSGHSVLLLFNFFLIFTGPRSLEFALSLRGDFGLGFYSYAGSVRTLAIFKDALNIFCIKRYAWVFWRPRGRVLLVSWCPSKPTCAEKWGFERIMWDYSWFGGRQWGVKGRGRSLRLWPAGLSPSQAPPFTFPASCLPCSEQLPLVLPLLSCLSALETADCGLKPLRLWAKINLSSVLWALGIVYQRWEGDSDNYFYILWNIWNLVLLPFWLSEHRSNKTIQWLCTHLSLRESALQSFTTA